MADFLLRAPQERCLQYLIGFAERPESTAFFEGYFAISPETLVDLFSRALDGININPLSVVQSLVGVGILREYEYPRESNSRILRGVVFYVITPIGFAYLLERRIEPIESPCNDDGADPEAPPTVGATDTHTTVRSYLKLTSILDFHRNQRRDAINRLDARSAGIIECLNSRIGEWVDYEQMIQSGCFHSDASPKAIDQAIRDAVLKVADFYAVTSSLAQQRARLTRIH